MKKIKLTVIMVASMFMIAGCSKTSSGNNSSSGGTPTSQTFYTNVATALDAAKALENNQISNDTYVITALVSSYVTPISGSGSTYKFNVVDSDTTTAEALVAYYVAANGFDLPKGGDTVVLTGKLEKTTSSYNLVGGTLAMLIPNTNPPSGGDPTYTQVSIIEDICMNLYESAVEDEDYAYYEEDGSYYTSVSWDSSVVSLEDAVASANEYMPEYLVTYATYVEEEGYGYIDLITDDESFYVEILSYYYSGESCYVTDISVYTPEGYNELIGGGTSGGGGSTTYTQVSIIEDICNEIYGSAIINTDYAYYADDDSYYTIVYWDSEVTSMEDAVYAAYYYMPTYLEVCVEYTEETGYYGDLGYMDLVTDDESFYVDLLAYYDDDEDCYITEIAVYTPEGFAAFFE